MAVEMRGCASAACCSAFADGSRAAPRSVPTCAGYRHALRALWIQAPMYFRIAHGQRAAGKSTHCLARWGQYLSPQPVWVWQLLVAEPGAMTAW